MISDQYMIWWVVDEIYYMVYINQNNSTHPGMCVNAYVCVCMCLNACVCVCVRACMRACVHVTDLVVKLLTQVKRDTEHNQDVVEPWHWHIQLQETWVQK